MSISTYITVAVISYLFGSIPFGYILVRLFTGSDVRDQGSGNIGATNVARTGRKGLAITTLLLDALKGFIPIYLIHHAATSIFSRGPSGYLLTAGDVRLLAALAALCAITGHMYPVWLKFKGGKGVATGLGVFVALAPKAVLVVLAVFVVIVAITRYVSLGSIVAALLFPVSFFLLDRRQATPLVMMMISAVSLLIVWKHRQNIRRLVAGNENKFGAKKT